MANKLHELMHRLPGVPEHIEQPPRHHGTAKNHPARRANQRWNHSPARPPRFMAGWQRRIAALFGSRVV
jgi:hypothetical protein